MQLRQAQQMLVASSGRPVEQELSSLYVVRSSSLPIIEGITCWHARAE